MLLYDYIAILLCHVVVLYYYGIGVAHHPDTPRAPSRRQTC